MRASNSREEEGTGGPDTWTNYINTVGQTDIDFPVVKAHKVA